MRDHHNMRDIEIEKNKIVSKMFVIFHVIFFNQTIPKYLCVLITKIKTQWLPTQFFAISSYGFLGVIIIFSLKVDLVCICNNIDSKPNPQVPKLGHFSESCALTWIKKFKISNNVWTYIDKF